MKRLILTLLLVGTLLQADIFETKKMKEILPHITKGALIVFDIDNTLIEPTQALGSDQWFTRQYKQYIGAGLDKGAALEKALAEWHSVQSITEVQLVEEGIAELVKELQEKGHAVIGLTNRGISMATRTVDQLERVGIDFVKSAPTQKEVFFINEGQDFAKHGNLYRGGILFTSGTDKGKSLEKWGKTVGYQPKHVIHIDDKKKHLLDVAAVFKEKYTGLRYGYLDEKVKAFNSEIANVQFKKFRELLTDKQAEEILGNQ